MQVSKRIMLVLVAGALFVALTAGVALAVTNIVGTGGDDVLRGTGEKDNILGRKGDDKLFGYGADDNNFSTEIGGLFAGSGDDVVYGGDGADLLYGDRGTDRLYGEAGDDEIWAKNTDSYDPDGAKDLLSGGNGDDYLASADYPAEKDIVRCGAGRDLVENDRLDVVYPGCEVVSRD